MSAHATERSAKPHSEAADKHKTNVRVRKASPLVHEQLKRNKDRSRDRAGHLTVGSLPSVIAGLKGAKTFTRPGPTADIGLFILKTELQATIPLPGVQIKDRGGDITVTLDDKTLFAMSLSALSPDAVRVAEAAVKAAGDVKATTTATIPLPGGGTVTVSALGGTSVSATLDNVTTTASEKDGIITITTSVPEQLPASGKSVTLTVVSTLTPSDLVPPKTSEPTLSPSPGTAPDPLALVIALLTAGILVQRPGGNTLRPVRGAADALANVGKTAVQPTPASARSRVPNARDRVDG